MGATITAQADMYISAGVTKSGGVYRNTNSYMGQGYFGSCSGFFLEKVYPDGHRFQQDNDPKSTPAKEKDL